MRSQEPVIVTGCDHTKLACFKVVFAPLSQWQEGPSKGLFRGRHYPETLGKA